MRRAGGCLLLMTLVVPVAGCPDDPGPGDTVRIGAVYPLSGPQASAGKDIRQGIELAVDVINGEYPELDLPLAGTRGLPELGGRPIEVIFADHGSTREGVRAATEGLIRDSEVTALMGAYESERTGEASEIAQQAGVPFLTATSTAPALTERGFDWFFRTTPTDATFVENAFQFIAELRAERGASLARAAVIHEDSAFGSGVLGLVKSLAPQYGVTVAAEVATEGAQGPVSDHVATLRAAEPDLLLFAVYGEEAVAYMRELKTQDFSPALIWANDAGFISPDFLQMLGDDAAYVTSREVWSAELAEAIPGAGRVDALYRERHGQDLDGNSARAFVGVMTLARAVDEAGETGAEAVREALRATDVPGEQLITPWAGIRFDASGQNTLGEGLVVQMLEGRYRIVWPSRLASEAVVFPFPEWSGR